MEEVKLHLIDRTFWLGKRVLITGHTGFKGSWLSLWLNELGANVRGIALAPDTVHSLFNIANIGELVESYIIDIRDYENIHAQIMEFDPQIVFHMAAQPLVRSSYRNALVTYDVNIMGTATLLEAAKSGKSLKAIVNVTTDKVYENNEWIWGYRETDPLGGHDPYASSKACSEIITASYRQSFFELSGVQVATARSGNVIGGGDWSLDRLVPDILRSLSQNKKATIRSPNAVRPWQHVMEPLRGYMILAQKLSSCNTGKYATAWNFGPNEADTKTVKWIVEHTCLMWSKESQWITVTDDELHEASNLKLDISKAKSILGWSPQLDVEYALKMTVDWYKRWLDGADMREFTIQQLRHYSKL